MVTEQLAGHGTKILILIITYIIFIAVYIYIYIYIYIKYLLNQDSGQWIDSDPAGSAAGEGEVF